MKRSESPSNRGSEPRKRQRREEEDADVEEKERKGGEKGEERSEEKGEEERKIEREERELEAQREAIIQEIARLSEKRAQVEERLQGLRLRLPFELLEEEIGPRLSFNDQLALGSTCRRLQRFSFVYQLESGSDSDDPTYPSERLLARFPNLTFLDLPDYTQVSDRALASLPNLTELDVMTCPSMSDAGFRCLKRLETLHLRGQSSPVSGHCLALLPRLTALNVGLRT